MRFRGRDKIISITVREVEHLLFMYIMLHRYCSIKCTARRFHPRIIRIIFQKVIPTDPLFRLGIIFFGPLGDVRRAQISVLNQVIEFVFCIDTEIPLHPCPSLVVFQLSRPTFEELARMVGLEFDSNELRQHLVVFCTVVIVCFVRAFVFIFTCQ